MKLQNLPNTVGFLLHRNQWFFICYVRYNVNFQKKGNITSGQLLEVRHVFIFLLNLQQRISYCTERGQNCSNRERVFVHFKSTGDFKKGR